MATYYRWMASLVLPLLSVLESSDPPRQLVQENIQKASVIASGEIESAESPKVGVTVAHFKAQKCYRGPCKEGDEIVYASFREGDRYDPRLLHTKLIVFLRKRKTESAPPEFETATDISEFPYSKALKTQILKNEKRHK